MEFNQEDLLLVTGATGLVGSHVVEEARRQGIPTRALCRSTADRKLLDTWGVEQVLGDLNDRSAIDAAVNEATIIVHCAAKVGDWGPTADYRRVNVEGLAGLLDAAQSTGTLRRFIHISSLGVYRARDHHGTDESEQPSTSGIDGYTLTKVEAEQLVTDRIAKANLPATVLRPGFIYGPRDRTVVPRILERLESGMFKYLGPGTQLMNNTYVGNLVEAVFLALQTDEALGRVYNITDGRLVTKKEFIETIAKAAGLPAPTGHVPLPVARVLAAGMETAWKLLGKQEAPLLSSARIKFLGLNLDYSIDRARRELDYNPPTDFAEAMPSTVASLLESAAGEQNRRAA